MPKASQKSGGSQKPKKSSQVRRSPSDGEDDDDQEYAEPTQTQRGSNPLATARKYAAQLDQAEVESKTHDLVRYLLIADYKKHPIKKPDINKLVLKELNRAFEYIMDRAKHELEQVFGIKVVDLDSRSKSYILVNTLENDRENSHLVCDAGEHVRRGLLVLVLSLIFMNNNEIPEVDLWQSLASLNLSPERTNDSFGDVKRLLTTEWVRQGYLEYSRRPHTEPLEYDLRWGPRAHAELSKRELLQFVCEIHGDGVQPVDWKGQYQDVLTSEGQEPVAQV